MRLMIMGVFGIAMILAPAGYTQSASAAELPTAPQEAYFESALNNVDRSNPESLTQAGDMHRMGVGTEKNIQEAFRYYNAASKMKYGPAQNRVAQLYFNGEGVKKDTAKGLAWLQEAAGNGSMEAMTELSARYALGIGIKADEKKSRYWQAQADKALSDMRSQFNIAQTGHSQSTAPGAVVTPSSNVSPPRLKPTEKAMKQNTRARNSGDSEREFDPYGLGNL